MGGVGAGRQVRSVSIRQRLYRTAGQKDVLVAQCSHDRSVWNMALEQATFWREWQGCTPNAAVRGLR
jgi:hypothetical protein